MTRKSLERRVSELESNVDDRDGFYHCIIGGDPDHAREVSGYYEWDDDQGVYINENGHTRDDAPESEFQYNIEYGESNE